MGSDIVRDNVTVDWVVLSHILLSDHDWVQGAGGGQRQCHLLADHDWTCKRWSETMSGFTGRHYPILLTYQKSVHQTVRDNAIVDWAVMSHIFCWLIIIGCIRWSHIVIVDWATHFPILSPIIIIM